MIKRTYLLYILLLFVFASCENGFFNSTKDTRPFYFPISSLPSTWEPYLLYDFNSQTILSQLYEGLVAIDQNTYQITPLLAEDFNYSPDFLVFTFSLRKDVFFHEHLDNTSSKRVQLKNEDVIRTFEHICLQENSPAYENVLKRIIGAQKFHEGKAKNIEGISIENGKIIIELKDSDPLFLQKLSLASCGILSSDWLNSKNASNKKSIPAGTGPFFVESYNSSEIILKRNTYYYLKDDKQRQLPYLSSVHLKVYPNRTKELDDFLAGKIDFMHQLDAKEKDRIFSNHKEDFNSYPPKMIYAIHPLLSTSLLLFNLERPIFEPSSHRRLFNYAIDRKEIYQKILHRRVEMEHLPYGLIPPIENIFNTNDIEKLNKFSLRYNPSKLENNASLLKDFLADTLVLNLSNNPTRIAIGKMVKKQIEKEIGIYVSLNILSPKDLLQSIDDKSADLYLVSLSSDFSNPLSLMNHFYGGGRKDKSESISTVNFTDYHNWYYDQFFEKASRQSKPSQQASTIQLAESELLKDPPFIALYYDHDDYIYYSYVHGISNNLTNSFYFRNVYLK